METSDKKYNSNVTLDMELKIPTPKIVSSTFFIKTQIEILDLK